MSGKRLRVIGIKRDMSLQPRATLHRDWIEEYAADMVNGAKFPPPTVFFDGNDYWLADGFHRVFAAEALGLVDIECDIRRGNRRDALLFSVGANADHGHRRTNDDKRRAVDIMLNDPEWAKWSNYQIAAQCGVVEGFVRKCRPEVSTHNTQIPEPRTVTRGGTTYPMNTANIGTGERLTPAPEPAAATAPAKPAAFDHEAARVRERAMDAIRALAAQPSPSDVIAAWNQTMGFGEPFETFDRALAWLSAFAALYREAEPLRWAKVQRAREQLSNAAE